MSQYKELQEQIAALQKQAEEARKQEMASVVAEIKAKMAEYGITAEDLGFVSRKGRKKTVHAVAKYRNPATGEQWTGKGRKPGWMVQALEQGRSMEEFETGRDTKDKEADEDICPGPKAVEACGA